jgi:DNA topoisomerase IB
MSWKIPRSNKEAFRMLTALITGIKQRDAELSSLRARRGDIIRELHRRGFTYGDISKNTCGDPPQTLRIQAYRIPPDRSKKK